MHGSNGDAVKVKSGGVMLKLSLGDASETYLFTLYENGFFRAEQGTSENDFLKEPYFERGWYGYDYKCVEKTYLTQTVDEIRKLADKIYNSKPENDFSDVSDYDTFRLKYKDMVVQINSSNGMTKDMLELKEKIIKLSPIEVAFEGA